MPLYLHLLSGVPPRTKPPSAEPFPTLKMVTTELEALEQRTAVRGAERRAAAASRTEEGCRKAEPR